MNDKEPMPPQMTHTIPIQEIVQIRVLLGNDEQQETPHYHTILTKLDEIILNFASGLVPNKGN